MIYAFIFLNIRTIVYTNAATTYLLLLVRVKGVKISVNMVGKCIQLNNYFYDLHIINIYVYS